MPYKKYNSSNNAFAAFNLPIADTDLTCVLKWKFWRFPTSNFIMKATHVENGVVTGRENIYVTTRTGATCTGLIRAYEPVPTDDDATTNIQQALNFSADDIVEVIISAEIIKDMQEEIDAKLAEVAWLRTWFWTNQHVRINRSTWAEESKDVTTWTAILSTDNIRVEKSTWDYEDFSWSLMKSDILSWVSQSRILPAWEAFSANDFICPEWNYVYWYIVATGVTAADTTIWNAASVTRQALRAIGNWISMSSMKLSLRKVWWPVDNFTVRIETDNWSWLPSWTLVHANATASVAWTGITTSYQDFTINFTWAFTISNNTFCHIVISRSWAVDASNYYQIQGITVNPRFFQVSTHNWTSYAAYTGTTNVYYNGTWFYSEVAVKTNATNASNINFIGITWSSRTIWQETTVLLWGVLNVFSWLTYWATYYLSNTPWTISTTPGTNIVPVWVAHSTTNLFIKTLPKDSHFNSRLSYSLSGIVTWNSSIRETIIGKVYFVSISVAGSTVWTNTVNIEVSDDWVSNWRVIATLSSPYNANDAMSFSWTLPWKYHRIYIWSWNSTSWGATIA